MAFLVHATGCGVVLLDLTVKDNGTLVLDSVICLYLGHKKIGPIA